MMYIYICCIYPCIPNISTILSMINHGVLWWRHDLARSSWVKPNVWQSRSSVPTQASRERLGKNVAINKAAYLVGAIPPKWLIPPVIYIYMEDPHLYMGLCGLYTDYKPRRSGMHIQENKQKAAGNWAAKRKVWPIKHVVLTSKKEVIQQKFRCNLFGDFTSKNRGVDLEIVHQERCQRNV